MTKIAEAPTAVANPEEASEAKGTQARQFETRDKPSHSRMAVGASRKVRIVVDALLAILLVLVVALPVTHAVAHEWVGIGVVVLAIVHVCINARRIVRMAKRHSPGTVLALLLDLAIAAGIVAMAASSLVLSEHVFAWLPAFPGASWARALHLAGSYWLFVLAFVHCGIHFKEIAGKAMRRPVWKWVGRVAFAACLVVGAYWFVQMGVWSYMTLQVQFAFDDPSVPWFAKAGQFAAIAVAIAGVSHYCASLVRKLA